LRNGGHKLLRLLGSRGSKHETERLFGKLRHARKKGTHLLERQALDTTRWFPPRKKSHIPKLHVKIDKGDLKSTFLCEKCRQQRNGTLADSSSARKEADYPPLPFRAL
jgi:hypothetical protein